MSQELLLEKWYRDVKVIDIFKGSGQAQRLSVARSPAAWQGRPGNIGYMTAQSGLVNSTRSAADGTGWRADPVPDGFHWAAADAAPPSGPRTTRGLSCCSPRRVLDDHRQQHLRRWRRYRQVLAVGTARTPAP